MKGLGLYDIFRVSNYCTFLYLCNIICLQRVTWSHGHMAMDRGEKIAGIKKADNDDNGFSEFDVFVLCVSTHKPNDIFSPQIDGLLSIVERISKEAKDGALVTIESTIPKGASRKVLEILNHRLHVAHAPHRWYALQQEEHGVNQLRVLGGVYNCCLRLAMQFYDGRDGKNNNNSYNSIKQVMA